MTDQEKMIWEIKNRYGLDSPNVFAAMMRVPREAFVPESYLAYAYSDTPIPISSNQFISQPYTVAFMTHLLNLSGGERVLEIGTGSGYQAAILSIIGKHVYTVEIIKELAESAKKRLKKLGFTNVSVKSGSGEYGWKEKSPYDAIIITAQVERVSDNLFDQLKMGGRLVAPVGSRDFQVMTKFIKESSGIKKEEFHNYVFVPLVTSKD